MQIRSLSRRFGAARPDRRIGLAVAVLAVALATVGIYPLKRLAPPASLSVVYLSAVLLVSAYWGLWFGLLTALLSAAAFNFFHLPPVGRFEIADNRNWVALAAFATVAVVVSTIAELARKRAEEAERERAEADLAAALARELLAGSDTQGALPGAARLLAATLGLPSAALELGVVVAGDARTKALALHDAGGTQIATLRVPRALPREVMARLQERVLPTLQAILAIALRRDAIQAEAVETAALRRSDDVKTALLRAVSHDLRTPLTAIVAAGHALSSDSLRDQERAELSAAVVAEGERLATLVDKLLDLSRLQAGRAEPRRDWVSIEDVVMAARAELGDPGLELRVRIDPGVPEIKADAAQLERAFANLLENASRYSGEQPVSIHVRRVDARLLIHLVDRGPGIAPSERERIFEPFYRGTQPGTGRWTGSGLGLAIAKGFIEANGGTISVQSLPGQGTSFIVSLPIPADARVGALP